VQSPDNSQNFNRYGYCFGNPFKYTDPSGEWAFWDDLGAFLIGGIINWVSNGCQFNVQGLSYFIAGGGAGIATLYAPGSASLIAGGLSAANSIIGQGFKDGKFDFKNVDFAKAALDGTIGIMTAEGGAALGKSLNLDKLLGIGKIQNPTLRLVLGGAAGGTVMGSAFGAVSAGLTGQDIAQGAWSGAKMGFVTGSLSGFGSAVQYSQQNKTNLFTGKPNPVMQSPRNITEPLKSPHEIRLTISSQEMNGDDFVHVTTPAGASNIQQNGLNEGSYVTKWKYVEGVTNGTDFETMLYSKQYQLNPEVQGRFSNGFQILKINGTPTFYSPRTNWVNGVPQWRFYQGASPSNIFLIK